MSKKQTIKQIYTHGYHIFVEYLHILHKRLNGYNMQC